MPRLPQFSPRLLICTRSGVRAAAMGVGLCVLGGCAMIGYTAAAVFPEKVEAAHDLEDRTTVVIVDDPSTLIRDREILHLIAVHVGDDLLEEQVVSKTIGPRELAHLEDRVGEDYRRMPIDRVGKTVGAEQVIHVNIESIVVNDFRRTMVCRVKVIDAVRRVRLFPKRAGGMPTTTRAAGWVSVEMEQPRVIEMDQRTRSLKQRELARQTATEVSRLFYTYKVSPQGDGRL